MLVDSLDQKSTMGLKITLSKNRAKLSLNYFLWNLPVRVLFFGYRFVRLFPKLFLRLMVIRQSLQVSS
jgi:hypothetical protein